MTPSKYEADTLEKAVIAFLRDALVQRYSLENIRKYPGFDAMDDASLEALQQFGMHYIYPEWEERCFQNQARDKLLALLANPRRLSPLTAVALKSLFRFGRHLPKAIDAGKQVINAFEATRTLENDLVAHISQQELPSLNTDDVARAASGGLAAIGKAEFEVFIGNMVALMELLTQRKMLTTGASVLRDIASAMEKRPDTYAEIELAGIRYAIDVMTEGMALFETLDDRAMTQAIQSIPNVEQDWFDRAVRFGES